MSKIYRGTNLSTKWTVACHTLISLLPAAFCLVSNKLTALTAPAPGVEEAVTIMWVYLTTKIAGQVSWSSWWQSLLSWFAQRREAAHCWSFREFYSWSCLCTLFTFISSIAACSVGCLSVSISPSLLLPSSSSSCFCFLILFFFSLSHTYTFMP